MLATLIGYARGAGLQVDWLVIEGDLEFFTVTKRIHNGLYGSPGDGGKLGARRSERSPSEPSRRTWHASATGFGLATWSSSTIRSRRVSSTRWRQRERT